MTNTARSTRTKLKTDAKIKSFVSLSKEAKLLVKVIAAFLLFIFVIIGLQAYTATLQYKNNTLIAENEYLQAEIDSLESQIVEETKVTSIEKTATQKYGMVYPTADNYIVIKENKKVSNDNLASTIRRKAYN